jgi:hypothetical protein
VNTKWNIGMALEEMHTVYRPWARYHQARGVDYTLIQRSYDGFVDRVAHPKIISVDDQESLIIRIPKHMVCLP